MAQPLVRIPLQYPLASQIGLHTYRIVFWLDLLNSAGKFVRSTMPFRLDTGADFTTISEGLARQLGFDYQAGQLVYPTTTVGKLQKPSYLTEFWFSLPTLSQWQFSFALPGFSLSAETLPVLVERYRSALHRAFEQGFADLPARFGRVSAALGPWRRPATLGTPPLGVHPFPARRPAGHNAAVF